MLNIPDEVKGLFQTDGIKKNIRIKFPDGERADITNANIVQNSVKFSESLCSRNEIKFGLCESSTFECEVVDIENIKGMSIFVQLEIDISSLVQEQTAEYSQTADDVDFPFYVLPYGLFIIDTCQKQADMSHRRIVAYSLQITSKIGQYQYNILRDKMEYERSIPSYSFSPYKLIMANYGRNRMSEIEYTEVPADPMYPSWIETIWKLQGAVQSFGTDVLCKTYEVTFPSNESDVLVYVDTANVSSEEIDYVRKKYSLDFDASFVFGSKYEHYIPSSEQVFHIHEEYKVLLTKNPYIYIQKWQGIRGDKHFILVPHTIRSWSNNSITGIRYYNTYQFRNPDDIKLYTCEVPINNIVTLEKSFDENGAAVVDMSDIRTIFESCVEIGGTFGKFDRDGAFILMPPEAISNLYPSETLYPSESLYPSGTKGYSVPSTYSSAWYDELSLPYGRVSATYKNASNVSSLAYVDIVDDYDINPDAYQIYDISNNYLIQNSTYTVAEITTILNKIASKIANIRYMPCNVKSVGMPWLEAGDTVALETTDGDILKTIILSRTISNEQNLQDNFVSY